MVPDASPLPSEDCTALAAEIERLKRVNGVLMDRVERNTNEQGEGFSLFQAAITLENQVRQRAASNRELSVAKKAADDANRAKSEFLAVMSHEIRTPMNGVIGMSELLAGTDLTDTQRRLVETIEGSAELLLGIINSVLDLSKIEAGRFELDSVVFDPAEIVEDTAEAQASRAAEAGVELTCRIDRELYEPYIGDPVRLRQVLTNLVGNAIKFTPSGEVNRTGFSGELVT